MSVRSKVFVATSLIVFGTQSFAAKDCDADKFLVLNYKGQHLGVSRDTIESMPQKEIETSTHWASKGVYKGPLLADVINLVVGSKDAPKRLSVYTWDNFKSQIPYSDLKKYGAILSTQFNKQPLKLEDWGPLYIMYPYDRYKDLQRPAGLMKFAWQVCRIDVE